VIKGTIKFSDIKPHGGDQRRAFEEMCFQLVEPNRKPETLPWLEHEQ
jgi:hypothetical protein